MKFQFICIIGPSITIKNKPGVSATELDEFGEPIEQTNAKKVLIKYYQNNKEQFLIDCLQGDQNERQYLYNQWIEDFFLVQN